MERLAGRIMLTGGVARAVLALVAGAMGALSLPPFDIIAGMFVAFTLLVWLLDGAAGRNGSGATGRFLSSFGIGWLFGLGYFVASLWWIGNALLVEAEDFAWALPLAILGLPAFLALYFGFAAAFARLFWSEGLGRIAALAAGFALFDYLRGLLFTGFPWNAIGYAAMPVPLMMQASHVVGIAGMTAAAVFVFAAPALLGTRRGMVPGVLLALLLVGLDLGYGWLRLQEPEAASTRPPVTVRLVQPAIDQAKKIDDRERAAIFEEHLKLSVEPSADGIKPDVIVWPETSIPFILTANRDALTRIADMLDDNQVLLAGAVREEMVGPSRARYYNSVYMISGKGEIIGAADKVHLVPFGEYMPLQSLMDMLGLGEAIAMPGGFTAAASRSLLTLPGGQVLYPLICYEIIFPDAVAAADDGIFALLNLTNDAWFGDSPGPFQHFQQARVRAVEAGLPLIRAANNGISALIDSRGGVIAGLPHDEKGMVQARLAGMQQVDFSSSDRSRNFWLLEGFWLLIAVFSRFGFIFGKN